MNYLKDGTIQEFDNNFTLMSPVICEALAVKEDRRVRTKVPPSSSSTNLAGQSTSKADASAMDVDGGEEAPKTFVASEISPSSSLVK